MELPNRLVQDQGERHVDEAGKVFGAFNISRHPIDGLCNTAEHSGLGILRGKIVVATVASRVNSSGGEIHRLAAVAS